MDLLSRRPKQQTKVSTTLSSDFTSNFVDLGVHHWHHQLYCLSDQGQVGEVDGSDVGAEGLKQAVIAWSNSYYVVYALVMTVAFTMLLTIPEPNASHAFLHWRPESEMADR